MTRSDKEIIVKEFIRLDECDATAKKNDLIMADMRRQLDEKGSIIIAFQDEKATYQNVIVPSWEAKEKLWNKEEKRLNDKIRTKNFWSYAKDAGLILLLAEVVKLSLEK